MVLFVVFLCSCFKLPSSPLPFHHSICDYVCFTDEIKDPYVDQTCLLFGAVSDLRARFCVSKTPIVVFFY